MRHFVNGVEVTGEAYAPPISTDMGNMEFKGGTFNSKGLESGTFGKKPEEVDIEIKQATLDKLLNEGLGKQLSPKQVDDITTQLDTIFEMQRLSNLEKEKQFGAGDVLGIPTSQIVGRLPYSLVGAFNPEYGDFLAGTGLNFQKNIRKPITGAQAGMAELQALAALAPSGVDTPQYYGTRAKTTIEGLKHSFNTSLKDLNASRYNVSGYKPFPESEAIQPTSQNKTYLIISPDDGHTEKVNDKATAMKAVRMGWRLK